MNELGNRARRRAERKRTRYVVERGEEPEDPLPIRRSSGNYCPKCKGPIDQRESRFTSEAGWEVRFICSSMPAEKARIGDVTVLSVARLCGWKSVWLSINARDVLNRG